MQKKCLQDHQWWHFFCLWSALWHFCTKLPPRQFYAASTEKRLHFLTTCSVIHIIQNIETIVKIIIFCSLQIEVCNFWLFPPNNLSISLTASSPKPHICSDSLPQVSKYHWFGRVGIWQKHCSLSSVFAIWFFSMTDWEQVSAWLPEPGINSIYGVVFGFVQKVSVYKLSVFTC